MLTVRVLPPRGVILRASLATVEIMALLIAAHTWAGGTLPAPEWAAVTAGLVFATGLVVLRRRAPMRVMVPALVAAQLLLHLWLSVLEPGAPAHHHHVHGSQLGLSWQMLLAHVAGGLATAVVWELRRRAVEVLLDWSDPGMVPVPALRRVLSRVAPVLPLRRPLVVVPLRGPPVAPGICA